MPLQPALILAAVLAALAATPGSASAAGGMQPGLWELTMSMKLGGKTTTLPPSRECVSQADIDNGNKTLPRPGGTCSLSNVDRSSERATYDIACTQETLASKGRADIRFAGDRYDGKVDLTVEERSGQSTPLTMIIAAKRVGDCSK